LEAGTYVVQLLSSAGVLLQTTEVVIETKTQRLVVPLVQVATGPYFIQLTNRKNNKRYSEIIVVQ
jgi:hypothetical protein